MDSRFNRLTGTDVLTYWWIIPSEAMIAVGELAVVTDEKTGIRYFARVTGMNHEFETGGLLVIGFPIGCIGPDGIFRKPRTIPPLHSPVRPLETAENILLRGFMGELEVGTMMSGNQRIVDLPVGIPSSVLNQHLGVFATTGMGKSNFMKVLCASAITARTVEFSSLIRMVNMQPGSLVIPIHGGLFIILWHRRVFVSLLSAVKMSPMNTG